ncbi:MAG: hypothetical protein MR866_10145 [Selenomonadaceae bacterium]|nr:hypothetical protein [Selenomonadaceae bacterium]
MRLLFPKEVHEMLDKIRPYIVIDEELDIKLKEGTPANIRKMAKKCFAIADKQFDEARQLDYT